MIGKPDNDITVALRAGWNEREACAQLCENVAGEVSDPQQRKLASDLALLIRARNGKHYNSQAKVDLGEPQQPREGDGWLDTETGDFKRYRFGRWIDASLDDAIQQAFHRVLVDEREACALLCDEIDPNKYEYGEARLCAKAIRARGAR
jgi:hypothetical protein